MDINSRIFDCNILFVERITAVVPWDKQVGYLSHFKPIAIQI